MVTLDWGDSFVTGRSVWDEFLNRLPVTLQLSLMGIAVAVLLGVPLGVAAALRQDTWVDYAVRVFSLGGVSLPHFWLATLVLLAGVRFFTWSPPPGYQPLLTEPFGNLTQFVWPALVLGYSGAGLLTRMTRYAVLEVMRQEYVRTAHAKGLHPSDVVLRHILRNALLPVITVAGIAFATLISGSVVLEQVFALPGTGLYLLDAVKLRGLRRRAAGHRLLRRVGGPRQPDRRHALHMAQPAGALWVARRQRTQQPRRPPASGESSHDSSGRGRLG